MYEGKRERERGGRGGRAELAARVKVP